jgi:hypothetical protein
MKMCSKSWAVLTIAFVVVAWSSTTEAPGCGTLSGLERLVLTASDLPGGSWQMAEAFVLDNRTFATECAQILDSPDDWLRRFEFWKRVDGYRVGFERKQDGSGAGLVSEVEVYKAVLGATEAFRKFKEINQSQSRWRLEIEAQGVSLKRLETREVLTVGDECYSVHAKMAGKMPSVLSLESVSVMWRREEVLGSVTWLVVNSKVLESDVVDLARRQDRHIKERLPGIRH